MGIGIVGFDYVMWYVFELDDDFVVLCCYLFVCLYVDWYFGLVLIVDMGMDCDEGFGLVVMVDFVGVIFDIFVVDGIGLILIVYYIVCD